MKVKVIREELLPSFPVGSAGLRWFQNPKLETQSTENQNPKLQIVVTRQSKI